ncbi:MAG TPA: hypothetical protein VN894_10345, partial [Polyangiaceae bacterium]|nr:hypothetical protein [Polyangiaceae bacterium]
SAGGRPSQPTRSLHASTTVLGIECIGPCVEAGAGKRFVLSAADRKALHVPACGVWMTENDDGNLLALTKFERLRGLQETVLVASFDRTHARIVTRCGATLTTGA